MRQDLVTVCTSARTPLPHRRENPYSDTVRDPGVEQFGDSSLSVRYSPSEISAGSGGTPKLIQIVILELGVAYAFTTAYDT